MPRKEVSMVGGGPGFSKRAKDVVFIKVGSGDNGYGVWNFWSEFDRVSSCGWMCPIENGRPRRKKNNTWVWVRGRKLTQEEEQKEFEKKKEKMTTHHGKPIPEGASGCNSCGGNGWDSLDGRKKCRVCRGKGYWTQEDIQLYHKDCTEKSCFGGKYGCGVKQEERLEREDRIMEKTTSELNSLIEKLKKIEELKKASQDLKSRKRLERESDKTRKKIRKILKRENALGIRKNQN